MNLAIDHMGSGYGVVCHDGIILGNQSSRCFYKITKGFSSGLNFYKLRIPLLIDIRATALYRHLVMDKNKLKKYAAYTLASAFMAVAVTVGHASYKAITDPPPNLTPWNNRLIDLGRFERVHNNVNAIEEGRKEALEPAERTPAPAFFGQG
jgi:hypothetical protein